jgi:multisubunit Na+/H+ antiporter MnhB subunit
MVLVVNPPPGPAREPTVKLFRSSTIQRPLALRSTAVAVGVALVVSALGSAAFTIALDDSVASGFVTFLTFGGLAALTAGVVAWEVSSLRACPRCGLENSSRGRACATCGYDLRARPRFACTEGHVAYGPGLCDCGRRLQELRPTPVGRHLLRALALAIVVFGLAILLDALLARGG